MNKLKLKNIIQKCILCDKWVLFKPSCKKCDKWVMDLKK